MALSPIFLLVVAAILFGLMSFAAKGAMQLVPGPEVAFFRFLVGLAACWIASMRRPFRVRDRRGVFLRGLYGGLAVLLYFQAIEHLPVGIATLLNYTFPVFAAAYAALLFHEPVGTRAALSLGVTMTGVALVVVGSMKGHGTSAAPAWVQELDLASIGLWHALGLLSGVLGGAAVATIRRVRRTDGSWEIFASFCAVGALVTLPQTITGWVSPSGRAVALMLVVGVLSVAAQLLMTWALGHVRAVVAGVASQLTPVAALLLGWAFLGDRLTSLAILGAITTITGVSWLALRER